MLTTTTTAPFSKRVRIGTLDTGYKRRATVHADIKWDGKRLSIQADARRRADYDIDCGGQMQNTLRNMTTGHFHPRGRERVTKLLNIWDRWHLNDMRAGCEHQRALGWTWDTHPCEPCPECGYKYGTAWLHEDVPVDVLDWLREF